MIPKEYKLNEVQSKKIYRVLIFVGIALLVLSFLSEFIGPQQVSEHSSEGFSLKRFFHSYLFSFTFFMSIVFGSFFFVILQFLTKAGWSVVVRRIPENLMKNIEVMIFLGIPLLFGLHDLFHWTHVEVLETDTILAGKEPYLNTVFFMIRVVFYFAFLFLATRFYYLSSIFQDNNSEVAITKKLQKFSPVVTILFALTITFFSIDFIMSLDPHWYSTVWGIYYFAGSVVVSLSVVVIISIVLRGLGFLKNVISIEHYHDLGKLIFSFNILWAYIAFSQYMLIWYANIPEETIFFIDRINGNWYSVSLLLIIGHFFVPLLLYISRNSKRNIKFQLVMTLWLFFMQMVDIYWLVMPNVDKLGFHIDFVDVSLFLGMGFIFFGNFLRNFSKHSILAHQDPYLQESLRFENS